MLLYAVSVFVVGQSSSEIPEGLMNNPVYVNGNAKLCLMENVKGNDTRTLDSKYSHRTTT